VGVSAFTYQLPKHAKAFKKHSVNQSSTKHRQPSMHKITVFVCKKIHIQVNDNMNKNVN